ncbi:MAG TPA: DEAD/DEAH box helicase [Micropepsaceae bacterium]|nr:DEAD/DEAH box helicase [Micropepsaceae bacterium]
MATFEELGLGPEVLKAVADSGYTTPTPIQEKAIPQVLRGRDVLGLAQTGTGKTASFTLPMIDILAQGRTKARMPRTLILEPTRELAAQVAESFERYGKYHKLSMALLIGGVAFGDQDKKLDRGVDVLIATPGRLIDQFERGRLMMSGVQVLVIDEADRMLDMGFIPDIERICKLLPFTRQTLFFSATMPPEITRLSEQFLNNPVRIEVARPATTASTIEQKLVTVAEDDKREALRRFLRSETVSNAIIFCNRKRDVDIVAKSLSKHGFNSAPIHGDLDQSVRTRTLDSFRSGELQLLVASDVAARGLDIPAVSHVFNFDVPFHADDYVHRIGRTGRAGRSGTSIMIATRREGELVEAIEKLTGKPITRVELEGLAVDPAAAAPEEGERRGPKGRNRRGGRGGRGGAEKTPRPAKSAVKQEKPVSEETAQPVLAEAVQPAVEMPVAPERPRHKPREERSAKPKVALAHHHAPAQPAARQRQRADHRRDHRRSESSGESGGRVIGFGDAMPAFMRQSARFTSAPANTDPEKETA